MAIHVALSHKTEYRYDRPVSLSPHVVRLRPAPYCRTPIVSYSLNVTPGKHFINWQQDPHSNYLARLVFPDKVSALTVEVDVVAEMSVFNPFDFFLEPAAEQIPFGYEPWLRRELTPFLETEAGGPAFRDYVAALGRIKGRSIDVLVALNRRVASDVGYVIRLEPGVQSPDETLTLGSGSCRDSGWLLVQVLRHLGLAARFVSGYLIQLAPDVKALDGPSGAAADFCDLHAWAEVYLPGAGWVGLDPTSGLLAGEGHLPLAATPDPSSAAPVTGSVDDCDVVFTHEMSVRRVFESPRVTKPYTDRQWLAIESLGHEIDRDLSRGDVRLTMGGEPTFVSIDDMDGDEWNLAALGTMKREMAGALLKRLQSRFSTGALLHYGQGKWYPGESLPRWALGCWWRRDGAPIWHDPSLVADDAIDYGHGDAEARQFIEGLVETLGVEGRHIVRGFEDAWHYLWKERRLPSNVDPLQADLKDDDERARLSRVLDRGLNEVVGYAIPIERRAGPNGEPGWTSAPWFFRSKRMFLVPGDSAMGYRLPLDQLPWVSPDEHRHLYPPDPTVALPPLPAPQQYVSGGTRGAVRPPGSRALEQVAPAVGTSATGLVRTALCVEARSGRLHVFMPPVATTEDYLELVSAVESTAAALKLPVVVEGTAPPGDPRLNSFKITPDPGVIEVNLQPAHGWDELVQHTTALYEEARLSRLGTEKFMIDGRHTGTGGGNHVVIGGASPADSPVLRRPDLLRSLVGFWHNHPSLSYLFSGLFIGPTSQHPRIDEARHDSLHELEIAFGQISRTEPSLPWVVDRVFRHLLTDVTGNTHRAEFCIDKLYSPDTSSGRLGLVELRSFEMPPHARMSLTQQLLLRALIARFWREPYEQPLARWGTALHDRFMLPHFTALDFDDVLEDLRRAGYPFELEWFAPHVEFRFPVFGSITRRGIHLEIRQALEPWHVLGEESGGGGTVRYVDSSVERVQVKVSGMTGARHVVACNGRRVPLHPTGTVGEFVAAVRYRAWQPPNCLHPTVPVHAPLVFDLVDTWNRRSLGGCVYHVSHPGGRSFETFPVNAYEAESRRLARFFAIGHTPGSMGPPDEDTNPDFPLTLDLRRGAAGVPGIA